MQGEFFLAWSNRSRTRLAPTPTNISTNSEPLMLKNGTPASPATALLSSVLPVPGGPTRSTPLGMRAPTAVNLSGYFRNSTISDSSVLASSTPATSAKVIAGLSPVSSRARLLPKDIAWLLPLCVWRKIQSRNRAINPKSTRLGKRTLKRTLLPLESLRKLVNPLSVKILSASALEPTAVWYWSPFSSYQVTEVPSPLMTASCEAVEPSMVLSLSLEWFFQLRTAWSRAPESLDCALGLWAARKRRKRTRTPSTARAAYRPRRRLGIASQSIRGSGFSPPVLD